MWKINKLFIQLTPQLSHSRSIGAKMVRPLIHLHAKVDYYYSIN